MPSAARSPPSLKLRLSNEDATCRLGLRGAAAPDPRQVSVRTLRAVQIGRNQCSVCPKQVYDIGRNHCTNATVLRVRHSPKRLFVFTRFAHLDIERFHALRHAFTTLLRASGTRDHVAMKMTGHRDAAMLDYYDEGLESEQIEAAQRLDERLRMLRDRA
jgi:integrase